MNKKILLNKKLKLISLISLSVLFSTTLTAQIRPKSDNLTNRYSQTEYLMGTIFQIIIYTDFDKEKANEILESAFKTIKDQENTFSSYDENSELNYVLKKANKYPIKISDNLVDILGKSLEFSEKTSGYFDVTIGPLFSLWGFKNKDFYFPSNLDIKRTLDKIGYKSIDLDQKNKTIFFNKSGLKINFGAIGKGYAIDKAKDKLIDSGINSGLINCTSTQYYLGTPPNKKYWEVAIKHPKKFSIIKKLKLTNKAVSTSGDYQNYFNYKGKNYSHIINPKTGYPINNAISSTVISDSATSADGLSTSILLLDDEKTKKVLKDYKTEYALKIVNENNKLKLKEY